MYTSMKSVESFNRSRSVFYTEYSRRGNRSSSRLIETKPSDLGAEDLLDFIKIKEILSVPPFRRTTEQLTKVKNFLIQTDYFKQVKEKESEEAVMECAKYLQYHFSFLKTFSLKKEAEPSKFYLIISGNVRVFKGDSMETEELCRGQSFGEGYFTEKSNVCQVTCLGHTHFATLDSVDFKRIKDHLLEKKFNIVLSFLKTLPVLSGLSKRYITRILNCFSIKIFKRKEKVFKELDQSDFVYFIDEGEFLITKRSKIGNYSPLRNLQNAVVASLINIQKIAILGKGEMIGDEDLVFNNPQRTVGCECYSDTGKLLVISSVNFLEYLGKVKEVLEAIKTRVENKEDNRKKISEKGLGILKLRLPSPKPPVVPLVSPRSILTRILTKSGHGSPAGTPRSLN